MNVGVSQVVRIVAIADCVRISNGSERRSGHLPGHRDRTVPSSPLLRLGANLTSATTARSVRSIVQVRGTTAAVRPTSRVLGDHGARPRRHRCRGLGSRLRLGGEAILGITQIGKRCHDRCAIFRHFSCRLNVLKK